MWKFLCSLLWCAALLGVVKADEDPTITIRLGIVDKSTYELKDDNRDLTCDKKPGSSAKSRTYNYVVTLKNKNKGEVDFKNDANPGVECIWEYNRCLKHSKGSVGFRGWTTKSEYRRITVRGKETPKTVFVTLYKSRRGNERFVVTDAQVNKKGAIIKRHRPFAINRPSKRDQQNLRIELGKARKGLSVSVKVEESEKPTTVPCNTFISRPKGMVPLVGDWSEASVARADQNSHLHTADHYRLDIIDAVEFILGASLDKGEFYCLVGNRWADRIQHEEKRELPGGRAAPNKVIEVYVGKGLERVDDKNFENYATDKSGVLVSSTLPIGAGLQGTSNLRFFGPNKEEQLNEQREQIISMFDRSSSTTPSLSLLRGEEHELLILYCKLSVLGAASEYSTADLDAVEFVLAAHDDGELYCLVGNRWADRLKDEAIRGWFGGKKIADPAKPVAVLIGKGLSKLGNNEIDRESQKDRYFYDDKSVVGFLETTHLLTAVGTSDPFQNARFRERSDL